MKKLFFMVALFSCTVVYANDDVEKKIDFLRCKSYVVGFVALYDAYFEIVSANPVLKAYDDNHQQDEDTQIEDMTEKLEKLYQLSEQNALLNLSSQELYDYLLNAYNFFAEKLQRVDSESEQTCHQAADANNTEEAMKHLINEINQYAQPSDKVFAQLSTQYSMPSVAYGSVKVDGDFSKNLLKYLKKLDDEIKEKAKNIRKKSKQA